MRFLVDRKSHIATDGLVMRTAARPAQQNAAKTVSVEQRGISAAAQLYCRLQIHRTGSEPPVSVNRQPEDLRERQNHHSGDFSQCMKLPRVVRFRVSAVDDPDKTVVDWILFPDDAIQQVKKTIIFLKSFEIVLFIRLRIIFDGNNAIPRDGLHLNDGRLGCKKVIRLGYDQDEQHYSPSSPLKYKRIDACANCFTIASWSSGLRVKMNLPRLEKHCS